MNRRLALLLAAAFVFRLLFIPTHGFKYDFDAYANWATLLATHGPIAMYHALPNPPVDYPPGYLYVLWAAGLVHAAIGGGVLVMRALIKIVPIVADLVVIAFCYRAARRFASERAAFILAGIVAFAPPLWFDSAFWGQSDSVPTAFLFGAIFALENGAVIAGLALYTIAIITKPQGLAIAPAVLVLCERAGDRVRRFALGLFASLAIAYVATLPFTLARDPVSVFSFLLSTYANGVAVAPYTTNGAFNLYTLITSYHQNDATLVFGIPYHVFGVALVALLVLIITFGLARYLATERDEVKRLASTLGAASLSLLVFFLFATRIHERYVLPAIALGAPLAVEDRPTAIALAWLALTFTINGAYSFKGLYPPGHPIPNLIAHALSLGNIIAFATLWHRQTKRLIH